MNLLEVEAWSARDSEELPFLGDAFELVIATVNERDG
jgi:hypothetical protein